MLFLLTDRILLIFSTAAWLCPSLFLSHYLFVSGVANCNSTNCNSLLLYGVAQSAMIVVGILQSVIILMKPLQTELSYQAASLHRNISRNSREISCDAVLEHARAKLLLWYYWQSDCMIGSFKSAGWFLEHFCTMPRTSFFIAGQKTNFRTRRRHLVLPW